MEIAHCNLAVQYNYGITIMHVRNFQFSGCEGRTANKCIIDIRVHTHNIQFQCCGYDAPLDWLLHNPNAVSENSDQPPNCPMCTSESTCRTYTSPR